MRRSYLFLLIGLTGCSFPGTVQRIAVDYNTTVAGMTNEVTLLNIVRAKEGMPLQYTGFNRMSGSISVTGTAKVNGALKGSGISDENTSQTAGTAITNTVKRVVTEGVDTYTPEVGGSITSGPSFDVTVYDTQKFYQGILSAIPFSTAANFIDQGFDNQVLMRLLVRKVEFKLSDDVAGYGAKGKVVLTLDNVASGPEALRFAREIACYRLGWDKRRADPKVLLPVSRLAPSTVTGGGIKLSELPVLDGQKFDLDKPIGPGANGDADVNIVRLSDEKTVATLRPNGSCDARALPATPKDAPDPIYNDDGTMMLAVSDGKVVRPTPVKVTMAMTLRSTEAVIRFVGDYLEANERFARSASPADRTFLVSGRPLFSISMDRSGKPVVSARLLDRRYYVLDDANRRQNMMVLALVQQLINLQKESVDRPTTVPVQVIP